MPVKTSTFKTDAKKGQYYKVKDILKDGEFKIAKEDLKALTSLDIIYRALCAVLYNYAPLSGHPGGSISSGRIVNNLAYNIMSYDLSNPDRDDADILSYAAGHKALGLYAMSALRNEIAKAYSPELLAKEERQLRLEDLLGFRRSPASGTKLLKEFNVKSLDGHPVPLTPFVKLSTGASGIGVGSSVGLGLAAAAVYGNNAPKVNIIEGEGGLTAGRSAEALAIASSAGLDNIIIHLDWNQASIDSDKVTAENGVAGDYVAWRPAELFYINGFNVIEVQDGLDFKQVYAAQKFAYSLSNGQPTAIVYRTVKGWHYGIEGKASHGGGHKFASDGFYAALSEFEKTFKVSMPRFCGDPTPQGIEDCFWQTLLTIRKAIIKNPKKFEYLANRLVTSRQTLDGFSRQASLPQTDKVYAGFTPQNIPAQFNFTAQDNPAIRTVMSEALAYIGKETGASMFVSTADLSGSTGAGAIAKPYAKGFYNKTNNPQSRMVAGGGICEDGLSAVMSGVSAFGKHIGVAASYAAFTAAMMHTQARLHAIGQQCYQEATGKPKNTFVIFNGHAGLSTGEDGPTHADPQCLQLIMEDFPKGSAITLTPLDGNDVWPLLTAALAKRPAVLYPVVIRPNLKIADRQAIGADSAVNAKNGVYSIAKAEGGLADGVIILQGAGAGEIFVNKVLPELKQKGFKLNVYYVASRELFTMLSQSEQDAILPPQDKKRAIAITDYTLPTMYSWLKSEAGVKMSLYPFMQHKYMTSGKGDDVYREAHLDAQNQLKSVLEYLEEVKKPSWR
jgi:transketolase